MKRLPIDPRHKEILDKIRKLWEEAGGVCFSKPDTWELDYREKSKEGIEIHFDCGTPEKMLTYIGSYHIIGGGFTADRDKFWELFTQEFEIKIVAPIREDTFNYQSSYSGPLVRINQKKDGDKYGLYRHTGIGKRIGPYTNR